MSAGPTGSPTEQLADFLTAVSVAGDEESAIRVAIERACGAFGAQIAAIGDGAEALSAIAPDRSAVDPASAERLARATGGPLEIPELGELEVLVAPIEDQRLDRLILGRSGERGFSAEESALARGMARAIAMAVRLHRVVDAERGLRKLSEGQAEENSRLIESLAERQRLHERLSKIQASIVRRHELGEVLEAIVAGAKELLGDETVGLHLIDPEDPEQLILVASAGVGEELVGDRRTRVGVGPGGRAVEQGELVVIEDYPADARALAPFVADGIVAALATPVREHGEIAGSLVVATRRQGRTYSRVEREMLVALAEHASLALTDARTVEDAIHQAFHDSLTGLPNRLLLTDRLEHSLARASRLGSRVAVLFVDLDDFKNVNDSLGHVAGDEVLRDASARLLGCLRSSDTAARFGGDEFVVLLEEVDESNVAHAANRILEALDDPFEIQGREILIGASIGIAVGSDDADDLLRNADLALYRAKAKGKGQQQVFEPEMHVAVVERMELEGALAKALREAELVLHYQPVLDLASRRLTGVEALVRWQHPTRGLLLPSEFLPVAEDSRLMAPLGRWVLETACEQTRAWRERHPELELMLCANLSSAQFNDTALVEQVRDVLAGTGLRADRLVLELTETALMREPEMVAEYMAELKRLGVRLAIDDFGTGNASLRHLARFPIDVLKVDRSFVRRIGIDHRQTAITDSIIGLGQELEMTVVAEGIETADQLAQLIALGCGYGQGFYLARPAPAEEIGSLLDRMAPVRTEQAGGHSARVAAG